MKDRVSGRLLQLKEAMCLHMTSTSDAFRMFSKKKKGFLTLQEF